MKKQKLPVTERVYIDNAFHRTSEKVRTVYEKADGTLWINAFGGGSLKVEKEDGVLVYRSNIRTMQAHRLSDVLAKIGGKL